LTNTLNDINQADEIDTEHVFKTMLAKNIIIITSLENIVTSLTLTKINLINPVILEDINIKEINNEQLTNASVADILE